MAGVNLPQFDRIKVVKLSHHRRVSGLPWPTIMIGALLAALFCFVLAIVQFATSNLAGTDDYFHIKFAQLMGTGGLKPAFPWLPLTILNAQEYYDHHFLFHVALIPFTSGDLLNGAKWASLLFASLACLCIWWLLHSQRVPYAWLWTLGLMAVSSAFLFRMSMVRPLSLALAVMAIALYLMFSRRYAWLLPLSFLFVWLYDAFPLIFIITGIYTLSVGLLERRIELRPLVYAAAGVGLGMLINPYFPENVFFTYRHIIPKITEATAVRVGNEWYPYTTATLLKNSPLALVAFLSGGVALGLQEQRMDARTLTSFLLAAFFGLLLFQSRRFIEYFPPFALIFAALAWAPLLGRSNKHTVGKGAVDLPGSWKGSFIDIFIWSKSWLPVTFLTMLVLPGMVYSVRGAQDLMQSVKPAGRYAQVAGWLERNTPAGERIFQTDWDDFPRLLFHNTHNTYLIGLDPTYMQLFDATLYDRWVQITHGDVEQPSDSIVSLFDARYIMSDLNHQKFIDQAEADPNMEVVYRDDEAVVFRIKD